MEQKWSEVNKFRSWKRGKPAEKVQYASASLAVKLQGTLVAPPWGLCLGSSAPMSLDRPRMGAMKSETHGHQEVRRTKFHKISSKPRGSTVRWLLWRWPCQAKSDPLRCTASGLSQMPVPCGNTSSQANLPKNLSLWTNRSSFLRSSFENKKRPRQKLSQVWPNKWNMKNNESQSSQHSQAMRSSESSVKYRPKAAQNLGMKQLIVTTTATRHPDLMVNTSLGLKSLNDRRKSWPLISTPGLSSDT